MTMFDAYGHLETLRLEREHIMRRARGRAPQEFRPHNAVRTRAAVTLHALADRLDRAA